jgi:CDP-diacylglycerol--serine O-phosphatidyltransferase
MRATIHPWTPIGRRLISPMNTTAPAPKPRPAGIYLLPNLLTTGALFSGFYAIVAAINGQFVSAVIAVYIAGLFDGLDGRVARLTHTQSAFGVQYDSLSDLVSFGLAPALVVYMWALAGLREYGNFPGKLGWLIAFLYTACAALRLARFNIQSAGGADKRFFTGLASPAAAGTLMAFVWTMEDQGLVGGAVRWATMLITLLLALAMVSRVPYFSFKAWPEKVPFVWILGLLLVLVAIASDPPRMLLLVGLIYVASGPAWMTWRRLRRRPASA